MRLPPWCACRLGFAAPLAPHRQFPALPVRPVPLAQQAPQEHLALRAHRARKVTPATPAHKANQEHQEHQGQPAPLDQPPDTQSAPPNQPLPVNICGFRQTVPETSST